MTHRVSLKVVPGNWPGLDPARAHPHALRHIYRLELKFRDELLLKLREQILVMDDLDDGPTMGDFTIDYFITQLMRYLEQNRDALEAMPPGVYAVGEPADVARPGVYFSCVSATPP